MRTHIETVRQPRRRARNDVIHLGSRNKQQLDEPKTGLNLPERSRSSPVGLAVSGLQPLCSAKSSSFWVFALFMPPLAPVDIRDADTQDRVPHHLLTTRKSVT